MSEQLVYSEPGGFIVSVDYNPYDFDPEEDFSPFSALLVDSETEIHPDTHYVDAGVVRELTQFPTIGTSVSPIAGGHEITLTGIPAGTVAVWPDDVQTNEDDGVLVCEVPIPGDYSFRLCNVRHFEKVITVNVSA